MSGMMETYDVALWRFWPSVYELPIVGEVQAETALEAALLLMQKYKLTYVGRAAIGCPDKTVERWPELRLETERIPEDEREESEVQGW